MEAMAIKAINNNGQNHQSRERKGYNDVARYREGKRDQPDKIGDQHKHKKRKHEGEEAHTLLARRAAHRIGNKFIGDFANRLKAVRDERFLRRAQNHNGGRDQQNRNHEHRRIGQHHSTHAHVDHWQNMKLMDRVHCHCAFRCHAFCSSSL